MNFGATALLHITTPPHRPDDEAGRSAASSTCLVHPRRATEPVATISAGNHPHGPPAPGHDHRPIATGPSGTDVPSADAARPEGPFTDHGPYRATATLPITSALDQDPNNPSTHWHPAVPPSRATVPATGEGPGAAPC
jgi:hypothetical protein